MSKEKDDSELTSAHVFSADSRSPAWLGWRQVSPAGANVTLSLRSALPHAKEVQLSIQPGPLPRAPPRPVLPIPVGCPLCRAPRPPGPKTTISHPHLLQGCSTICLFTPDRLPGPGLDPLSYFLTSHLNLLLVPPKEDSGLHLPHILYPCLSQCVGHIFSKLLQHSSDSSGLQSCFLPHDPSEVHHLTLLPKTFSWLPADVRVKCTVLALALPGLFGTLPASCLCPVIPHPHHFAAALPHVYVSEWARLPLLSS